MKKRPRDKPYTGKAPKVGTPRDGYIWRTTVGGVRERERCVNIATSPKSGKRRRFSTLKERR